MKFALFVEGDTERRALPPFLKRWLDPRLSTPVGIDAIKFPGTSEYVKSFAQRAQRDLGSERLIAVVGLLDLYGADLPFPPAYTTEQKRAWGKGELERQVADPRFRQHFAVHETEAWLLSDPTIFPAPIQNQIRSYADRPETVNLREPPSKLLHRIYATMGRHYKKTTDGFALFAKLDPELASSKCNNLKRLLADMLSLAKAAGL